MYKRLYLVNRISITQFISFELHKILTNSDLPKKLS